MRRVLFLLIVMVFPGATTADDVLRHALNVSLDPAAHRITATDTVTLERGLAHSKTLRFALHKGLAPRSSTPNVKLEAVDGAAPGGPYEEFSVTLPPGAREFQIEYAGAIFHPLSDESTELSRGMRESIGMIGSDGVFLEGASGWYPRFDDGLLSFSLEVRVPGAWDVVSQGARTRHDVEGETRVVRWEENHPQDEIFIIAAPFTEYTKTADGMQALVMLRGADEALAQTYLDATVKYVNMYSALLGAYPYAKFALVENFWETGFGMPSFTLLGSKVIRLPFIVSSSYPHEILHNWWGNGVYVDYATGNWAEGLTSYLADHLLQEQRGDGANHRRAALQKYADFVSSGRDFPLTEFRSRHSSVTEAVGYGKTLMLFHMLRLQLGDAVFVKALREFYASHQFKVATFDDIKRALTRSAGVNLDADFDPWVKRDGAPALRARDVRARPDGDGFVVRGRLEQTQDGTPFTVNVPVAIHMSGVDAAFQTRIRLTDKSAEFELRVPARPARFDVDPEFDVFRRLDRSEIPPALSQLFGADKVLMLIPFDAPPGLRNAYEAMARTWRQAEPNKFEIKRDVDVKQLPIDRAVWVLGWENRHRAAVTNALQPFDVAVINQGLRIGGTSLSKTDHPVVLSAPHPSGNGATVGWIAAARADTLPALARKLPHYARYSYLGFDGATLSNILKGQWPVVNSALSVSITQDDGQATAVTSGKLAPRAALAP